MKLYCLEGFKTEVEKLSKNKSYKTIAETVIAHFCGKSITDLNNGTRLNNSDTHPYIKKRLEGSGGYRVYYLMLIVNDCVYLMYIHPKTGSDGSENITNEAKSAFLKEVLEAIKNGDLYEVTPDDENKHIIFSKKLPDKPLAIKGKEPAKEVARSKQK
jgi:hypothetical protein